MGTRVVFEGRVEEVDSWPRCEGHVARGLSVEDHGAKSQCEEHGIMPFRWPWLFRNLVVRLRLSWEEREECKLTSQAMKR